MSADAPVSQIPDWVMLLDALNEMKKGDKIIMILLMLISNYIFEKLIIELVVCPIFHLRSF